MKSIFPKLLIRHYLFFSIIIFNATQAQVFQLPNEWKFKLGDDPEWASLSFNDADWGTKQVSTSWSAAGVEADVYSWYRVKIVIPSSMKNSAEKSKGVKLCLGKIDDVDQTFFNGKLIGQTGSLPPNYETKWDTNRVYIISENEVQWDKENVIAVRVFSPDIGGIGMYLGPYTIGPINWSDFISVQQTITETDNYGFVTSIKFVNRGNASLKGKIKYRVQDKSGKELFTEAKPVQTPQEKDSETVITFSNYQPGKGQVFLKVGYQVEEDESSVIVKSEQFYLADRHIEIEVAEEPKVVVENKIQDVFTSIPFQDQQLQGYLGKRLTQNLEERLLKVDEDGMIDAYLHRPGNHAWGGEHVGKYLEAACNVWKNTHDARLKQQMDRMMYELVNSQLEDGYLGTYTPDTYWTSWDVWSHKYNLYGLLAYYTTTGYQPALDACKRIGDLLYTTFGNKSGQRDIILAGEHVGMAATSVLDPMVELYKYTGEKKYLDFCYYILDAWEQNNGPKIISALVSTGKVNKVANGKAYEMLSNLVGLMKLYCVTGDVHLLKPVLIAWNDIVSKRLYITGTTSSWEHFQDDEVLPAADKDHIGEGCVTTTWVQLNQNLLSVTGDLKYLEQIEKSIYNHLLGAENPETGCISYYTPLMDKKPFICYISCCTSSIPRGIAMIPYFTFGNVKNIPTLMLYEPATYKGKITTADKKEIEVALQVESNFPESGDVIIKINTSQTASFSVALRVPSWSTSFKAKVGGKEYRGAPNQYLMIERVWKSGEKIKVSFKIPIKMKTGGKSYPGQIAVERGPQVLAFDNSLNHELFKDSLQKSELRLLIKSLNDKSSARLLPKQWIGKQAYTIIAVNNKKKNVKHKLILVPFADASQTGGPLKVWLPLKVVDK
ncbi:MAG: glycoside hydrolase family 127 protein [Ignavibacteriaceae bacterium]|nr:glycoside hydrolase family 127 protein [Ignavibacteriaceae bacterium]